jgi:hypothetical protein
MSKYYVVHGGDPGESGIWERETETQIVSDWGLRKWHNTTAIDVCCWSDKAIARLVKRHEEMAK